MAIGVLTIYHQPLVLAEFLATTFTGKALDLCETIYAVRVVSAGYVWLVSAYVGGETASYDYILQ